MAAPPATHQHAAVAATGATTRDTNSNPILSAPIDRPTLACDWREWAEYLDGVDATDAQKKQMVESLWAIVVAFVDLQWDVRSDAPPTSESGGQVLELSAVLAAAVVNSKDIQNTNHKEEV